MIHPRTAPTAADVATHYDELDAFYRELWGEQLHHGFWTTGRESAAEAASALTDLVADALELSPGMAVIDIGCGYGATAERIAARHGVAITGVTLAARQAERARMRAGVTADRCDWLANEFVDGCFDRAYAIESTEHFADLQHGLKEARRVLRPDGRLAVCAWIAATDPPDWQVRHLLEPICREGRLAGLATEPEYVAALHRAGFVVTAAQDHSAAVARTWKVVAWRVARRLATDRGARRFVRDRRAGNRVFLATVPRLILAYRLDAIRYCLFVARKIA